MSTLRHPLGGRVARVVWSVSLLAYGVAVFQRYSLGVAGVQAGQRFHVGAATLAVFPVLQLLVYAAMQIPVGVLLDRLGSRRLLAAGSVFMAVGQLGFALAHSLALALASRALVGLGDAMTFMSVLRLVMLWFPARRNPILVQLTGFVGQLGAIVAVIPLVALLHSAGWGPTFTAAAVLSVASAVLVLVVVRDSPYDAPVNPVAPSASLLRQNLLAAWREPGTRLGLWSHFVTQFPMLTFTLLWGYPFLVQGEGLPRSTAGLLLTALTVAGLVSGPVIGHFVGRLPFYRSSLILGIVGATGAAWTAILLWPGRAPLWLLAVLMLVMATNGPGSAIGFDYARTFNPATRFGAATGIVNSGGFIAGLITILLVGIVLDGSTPGASTDYGLGAFKWAFAVQYVIWAVGVAQVLRYRRAARRLLAQQDPDAYAALRSATVRELA